MFQLAQIKRMVRVPPWLFGDTLNNAVADELNRKLANKVVLDVGLCIALFDIISLKDSYIFPGDGASHTHVTFRFIVFRPFMEEILEGTIKGASAEGIQVTLGFFDEIFIRKDSMMTDTHYDETEKTWVWNYQTDDANHQLFMDIVIEEKFTDTTPSNPNEKKKEEEKPQNIAPYVIYGSIVDDGLGMVSWWTTPEETEEMAEEMDASES
ncbi:DNA-directed RNA polymerase III subunit RPC8 [Armadillidium vulgare]|nr:DNA-directed RNA polymerase III subunit RPC8 [Armadillidium vulgare]